MRFLLSEVFDVAGGDVVGWVGVEAQVAVVGVAEAALELGAVVPGGFRTGTRRCGGYEDFLITVIMRTAGLCALP
jgi:hypothetical protein